MGGSARGRFLWYDLMTTDEGAARDFYGAVAGWSHEEWDAGIEGEPPYTMFVAPDGPMGGVMELPEEARTQGAPPHWLAYIGTDDVDATTARARELGATVHVEPMDIPTVGRFSVLQDPQGASIAFFTPEGDMVPPEGPGHGRMSWHELATSDQDAAWSFYHELFGWEKTSDFDMGDAGLYEIFGVGGQDAGAVYTKTAEMPGPPAWTYYVRVPDLDAAVDTVGERGGSVVHGPAEVPGGDRIAVCTDPQGAVFALHEKSGADAAGDADA